MKNRYAPVALWLAAIIACIVIVTRTEFSADLTAFLPRSASPAQEVLVEQLRDGVVSRLILAGIEGAPPAALAQASKRLASALRTQDAFLAVDNGEEQSLGKDREFLWNNRYLLSPAMTPEHFSGTGLRAALEDSVQSLGSPAALLTQRILPNDPTGELLRIVGELEGQARPATREGVWFSRDGARALLVIQTRAAGYDIDAQARALDAIRAAFSKTEAAPGARLLVTGPAVFSVSTRALIKDDAWRFSLIATALIAALLLTLYRSPRVLVLGLLPVASGALAGVASVSLGFGAVHGITLGFGATLIGEGVDYAIYLFTQMGPGKTPRAALQRIWPTLRLGLLTSICGFGAMLFSGFQGLAQLGLFSITGLLVAVAVTRWVLPALIPAGFEARAATTLAPRMMAIVGWTPKLRYPAMLVIGLAAIHVATQRHSLWSDDLSRLSPIPVSEQRLDGDLRREIGAPDVRHLVVVTAEDRQAALRAAETTAAALRVAADKNLLDSFDSPAVYLPSIETQRARQAAIPAAEVLRKDLIGAAQGLPFRDGLFEPFLRDAQNAKSAVPLERQSLDGTRLALKVDSLLVRRAAGWAAILPLRGVTDAQAVGSVLAQPAEGRVVLLDLKRATDEMFQTYRREALDHALLGAAAIVLLLLVALRSPRRVAAVVAPLAAAVTVTFSVLLLAVGMLTMFHLVGLLLVIAVGSNYALFFERYGISDEGSSRTITSVFFATLTTVLGFGVLSFSKVPVLSALGSTVGLGGILSFVFSAIFLGRPRVQRG
ncbi:MAG TPA: MMPL family transporter [Burkholderiales bacterium]|nr:MMPL family transporter [Burkholderiales bacterium]